MSVIKYKTIFCDVDGTIIKYRRFTDYLDTNPEPIQNVIDKLNELYEVGHRIILTTARPENMYDHTVKELKMIGLKYHTLLVGLERGSRYLINDMEDPMKPRAISVNVVRDQGFTQEDLKKFT